MSKKCEYNQVSYDEDRNPVAGVEAWGVDKEELIKCLKLLISGVETVPVANPNG